MCRFAADEDEEVDAAVLGKRKRVNTDVRRGHSDYLRSLCAHIARSSL